MRIACADCGCLVEDGRLVRPCGQHPACCCADVPRSDDVDTDADG